MPETFREKISRILRDHQGYTGDGQGGVGDLPIGDRSTARKPIEKRDLRNAFLDFADVAEDAQAAADSAAINAGSVIDRAWFPTVSSLTGDNNSIIGYAGAGAQFTVADGDLIEAGGFRYQVAAEGATDPGLIETAGGVKLRVLPVGGAYPLDAFGDFSGAVTGSRDNDKIEVAVNAAFGKTLRAGDGPYDFDAYPVGLDNVHIEGSPFAQFANKALPMFSGVYTGNSQVALVAGVIRQYENTENLGSGYVDGEACDIVPVAGSASGATCTVTVAGAVGGVATISAVTNGGSGYTNNQQCNLVGANGVGCQVKVTVSGGVVTAVTKVSGWYFLRDANEQHDPALLGPVFVSGSASISLGVGLGALGLDPNLWTPSGVVVGPDETLAAQGVTVGASVGLTSITLQASSGAPPGVYITYNGTTWTGTNAGIYDFTWVQGTNAYLQIDRKPEWTRGNVASAIRPFSVEPRITTGGAMFHAVPYGFSTDGMQVGFFDASGTRITDLATFSTNFRFAIIDPYILPGSFDWGVAPPRGGNFWIFGMFIRRPATLP
ncbi:hypothetical protein PL335_06475 [Sulfitobacter faviae]|uniref:hypothetical protein n=1 Tax=Sulfitobacter faviae TaxID=1775881 RepID=UPI0023075B45|nr:hypothetical protein [Sulfitobacter faviae]WCE67988.1 hypothetical protein PL335_06475 [Sulfitobacter faviae]